MSLYQRSGIWWIYLVAPNGSKVRRSTDLANKQEAQQQHDLLKAQLIKAPQSVLLGNHTWQQASNRWLKESKHKATWGKDKMVLNWFGEQIGHIKLRDIKATTRVQAIELSKEMAMNEISVLRTLESSFANGLKNAFWSQQAINAELSLNELRTGN